MIRLIVKEFKLGKGEERQGELVDLAQEKSNNAVFRFDLIRDIFLERGL
jgi:hypothetical protein